MKKPNPGAQRVNSLSNPNISRHKASSHNQIGHSIAPHEIYPNEIKGPFMFRFETQAAKIRRPLIAPKSKLTRSNDPFRVRLPRAVLSLLQPFQPLDCDVCPRSTIGVPPRNGPLRCIAAGIVEKVGIRCHHQSGGHGT